MAKKRGLYSIAGLLVWIALSFVPSLTGVLFTPGEWYRQLTKPSWNPPDWIFGPVWTALYALMGIAAWRVWRTQGLWGGRRPLALFLFQLLLNGLWTFLFFGLHQPAWAFAEIVLLWLAILATLQAFYRVDRPAGWLLAPYLAWVSFAAVLNFALWLLNR